MIKAITTIHVSAFHKGGWRDERKKFLKKFYEKSYCIIKINKTFYSCTFVIFVESSISWTFVHSSGCLSFIFHFRFVDRRLDGWAPANCTLWIINVLNKRKIKEKKNVEGETGDGRAHLRKSHISLLLLLQYLPPIQAARTAGVLWIPTVGKIHMFLCMDVLIRKICIKIF